MIQDIVESYLGVYSFNRKNDYAYYCPKCHWKNPRLMVNYEENKFHCWYCGWGSKSLLPLLKELEVDWSIINQLKNELNINDSFKKQKHNLSLIDKLNNILSSSVDDNISKIGISYKIPNGYEKIDNRKKFRIAKDYLKSRKLSIDEIYYYNIHYNSENSKLLIPSYGLDGKMNYYLIRSIIGKFYEIPENSKKSEILFLEDKIDYKDDIILVEGFFDATNVGYNAQPLLGTHIPKSLIEKISNVKSITLFLDSDALEISYKHAKKFYKMGIKTYIAHSNEYKDPNSMTKSEIIRVLKRKIELNTKTIIQCETNLKSMF